jgi:hypothetical protein
LQQYCYLGLKTCDSRLTGLPGGVIGNTGGFGPPIPGSSPGRVVEKSLKLKSKNCGKEID